MAGQKKNMSKFDLRKWIAQVEEIGEIFRVSDVDLNLEVGTITELNCRRKGPALIFDNFNGFPKGHRLLSSSIIKASRLGITFGLGSDLTDQQLVSKLSKSIFEWEKKAPQFKPKEVNSGPVQENIMEGSSVDIFRFPAPLAHERDGGKYIGTGCVAITGDPETGELNMGTYRSMLTDRKDVVTLWIGPGKHGGIHRQKYFSAGKSCPVVISFGHHPLLLALGGTNVQGRELDFAGAALGEPMEFIRGRHTNLPIPSHSEIVIEGEIDPNTTGRDGLFGEWPGYYSGGIHEVPLVKIKSVYFRDNPIGLAAIPAKPPDDISYLWTVFGSALVRSVLERAGIPDVKGVWCHEAGCGKLLTAVSIKQRYVGHSRQAGFAVASSRQGGYANRYIVVVDEDINPSDISDLIWAMCTRSDPDKSIDIMRNAWTAASDPMVENRKFPSTSRAVIDACKPFQRIGDFPLVNESSEELKKNVLEKWKGTLF